MSTFEYDQADTVAVSRKTLTTLTLACAKWTTLANMQTGWSDEYLESIGIPRAYAAVQDALSALHEQGGMFVDEEEA